MKNTFPIYQSNLMRTFFLLSFCFFLSFQLPAQMCDVTNGNFQAWDSVRQEHPWQPDSLDFYWPNQWQPFIWNGIDDHIEQLVPGADGMNDTAVAMYSTEYDANLLTYLACDGKPTVLQGAYYHEGAADDTLTISVQGVRADTSGGNSNLDSLVVDVLFDEIAYDEVILVDTQIIGGAQAFTNFSIPLPYLISDTTPNLIFVIASFNRGPGANTDKRIYALDNIQLLSNSTALDENFETLNAALEVYPNPAHSQVIISPPFQESYKLTMINLYGQTLAVKEQLRGETELDITAIPKGLYVLVLENEQGHILSSKKFIKE